MGKSVKLWRAMTPRPVINENVEDIRASLEEALRDLDRLTSSGPDDVTEFEIDRVELAATPDGVEIRITPDCADDDFGYASIPFGDVEFLEFFPGAGYGNGETAEDINHTLVFCERYTAALKGLMEKVERERKLAEEALSKL
ncbi:MAG: hypothetical protein ACPG4X_15880 [Pikeienuella sp.]